ncbi:Receptor for retinol uptake STRA6 [Clarias magur]|uniref:Receptor for retinol uptake STRA6 n=1 Tax=Clarias magur TaxID=1594786 RepID=A0A8J4X8Q6_CLAMG|nr:Receptor for retinol uptake STRA6 [Clarias magur]
MATFIKENLEGHTSWRLLIGREKRSSMTLVVAVKASLLRTPSPSPHPPSSGSSIFLF